MQKCAACHGVSATAKPPVPAAANLLDPNHRPGLEQVRRAIIDGRPGMPKGLLGGSDVDQIAAYLSGQLK
jgi:mono/diheme cytochrome c family protein